MGLTWITGLAAGFVDLEPVWYVFVGLNTLQGLFIFVAFTCNKKVFFFFFIYPIFMPKLPFLNES